MVPGRAATRPSLLLRLRDPKDDEAWRTFVDTYTPLVYAYCRRRGLQDSDVADVTQEVMAQVLHSISDFSYRAERGRFRDWLGTVTRTKIVRFLSKDARAGKGGDAVNAEIAQWQAEGPESDTLWTEAFQARRSSKWRCNDPGRISKKRHGKCSSVPGCTTRPRSRSPGNFRCRSNRFTLPGHAF